jgi:hypothetical protein
MASALLGEKLAHLRADIRLGLYKLSHPALPKEGREAAQESNIVLKSVATGTLSPTLCQVPGPHFISFHLLHVSFSLCHM